MSVPQWKLGQLLNEPRFENKFVEHFYTSQNIEPVGHVILQLFDTMITLAGVFPSIPKVIKNGTNAKYQEDFLFISGKSTRNVLGIQCKICIVVAPYETTLHNVNCDYLLVVGGKNLTIKESNINSLMIYGTKNVTFSNLTIIDTHITIADRLKLEGEYFKCDNNYITVRNFSAGNTLMTEDAFYLMGLSHVNLNKTNPAILDRYPNMYLCSMEYANKIVVFKVSPTMIHLRITWLIWALWNVHHCDININKCHLTLLENRTINSGPNYLRMARYAHERNPYYCAYYNTMVSINMHLSDREIDTFKESTNKSNITTFDLIPQYFESKYGHIPKLQYLIKSI